MASNASNERPDGEGTGAASTSSQASNTRNKYRQWSQDRQPDSLAESSAAAATSHGVLKESDIEEALDKDGESDIESVLKECEKLGELIKKNSLASQQQPANAKSATNVKDEDLQAMFQETLRLTPTDEGGEAFSNHINKLVNNFAIDAKQRVDNPLETTDSKEAEEYRKAVEDGTFDWKSKIGYRWCHAVKKEPLKGRYAIAQGKEAKEKIMVEWAQTDPTNKKKYNSYCKTLEKNHILKRKKLTFGGVVKYLGGWKDPSAIRGAKTLCTKCAILGPPWIEQEPFSEMWFFQVLSLEETEVMKDSWHQLTNALDTNKASIPDEHTPELAMSKLQSTQATLVDNETPEKGVKPVGPDRTVDASKVATVVEETEDDQHGVVNTIIPKPSKAEPEAGSQEAMEQQAAKLKSLYTRVKNNSDILITQIQCKESGYAWADNDENRGQIEHELQKLTTQLNDFGREYTLKDAKACKETFGDKYLTKLTEFVGLQPQVFWVASLTKQLLGRCKIQAKTEAQAKRDQEAMKNKSKDKKPIAKVKAKAKPKANAATAEE